MTRVAIAGAAGRMGRHLVEACVHKPETTLTVALEHAQSSLVGSDAGAVAGVGLLDVPIESQLTDKIEKFDVLVDFTQPTATLEHLAICRQYQKRMVIGTTGLTRPQQELIEQAAADIAIVWAPNMSVGMNIVFKLLEVAAQAFGEQADIEIIEAHHRHKLDAPSGTALKMGQIIAQSLNRDLEQCAIYGRQGHTGARDRQTIGFETIRAGDIVGEHTVMFADTGERVEISHKASSRMTFAKGALRAAHWVMQHQQGLFDMQAVLGLKPVKLP